MADPAERTVMMQDRDCGDENDAFNANVAQLRAWKNRFNRELMRAMYLDAIGSDQRTPEDEAWLRTYLEQLAD